MYMYQTECAPGAGGGGGRGGARKTWLFLNTIPPVCKAPVVNSVSTKRDARNALCMGLLNLIHTSRERKSPCQNCVC